jgi:hypothetical protein
VEKENRPPELTVVGWILGEIQRAALLPSPEQQDLATNYVTLSLSQIWTHILHIPCLETNKHYKPWSCYIDQVL